MVIHKSFNGHCFMKYTNHQKNMFLFKETKKYTQKLLVRIPIFIFKITVRNVLNTVSVLVFQFFLICYILI